jgi:hypothetical protein
VIEQVRGRPIAEVLRDGVLNIDCVMDGDKSFTLCEPCGRDFVLGARRSDRPSN